MRTALVALVARHLAGIDDLHSLVRATESRARFSTMTVEKRRFTHKAVLSVMAIFQQLLLDEFAVFVDLDPTGADFVP